jgi:hypothetical protein
VGKPQDANGGFQVFAGAVGVRDVTLGHLNPQTQERVLDGRKGHPREGMTARIGRAPAASAAPADARSPRHLAP